MTFTCGADGCYVGGASLGGRHGRGELLVGHQVAEEDGLAAARGAHAQDHGGEKKMPGFFFHFLFTWQKGLYWYIDQTVG